MAYVPKNKIQTGLYTGAGTQGIFVTITGISYTGPYYKLYNGKYFSGKDPNDPSTQEIFPVGTDNVLASKSLPTPSLPLPAPLFPTEQDYKNGSFIRYFSLRLNQPLFVEISKDNVRLFGKKDPSVPWKTNKTFSLIWTLTGDKDYVAQTNKNITELTEQRQKAYGLSLFLKEDWIQYYKEKV
jgi:hypothetical protein